MKNMSAKLKLTLLTSSLLTLMAVLIVALLFLSSDIIAQSSSRSQVMKVVENNADELEYEDRRLDTDDIDFFKNGVYTLLYTQTGTLLHGDFPEEFSEQPPLMNNTVTEVTINETLYYIYDILAPVEDHSDLIWVRGLIAVDEAVAAYNTILTLALYLLPLLILFGTIGSYFIVKFTFRPIDKMIKTAEDISLSKDLSLRMNLESSSAELRKLATAFDNMLNRLEGAFESEKQFSQNVSHELRTPIAVILAQCEYALGKNASEADRLEALEITNKQALKMSRLSSELLKLMRLERGIEQAELSALNLSELAEIVCEEQSLLKDKNISLTWHIEDNICVHANRNMMIRLITNLLSNAYRYGKDDGTVTLRLSQGDERTELSVQDDGIGIADEHLDKIWQRFYQVDGARSADEGGSMGLGLSMVWHIAKVHGASVEVQSVLGEGSTFKIIFPF